MFKIFQQNHHYSSLLLIAVNFFIFFNKNISFTACILMKKHKGGRVDLKLQIQNMAYNFAYIN